MYMYTDCVPGKISRSFVLFLFLLLSFFIMRCIDTKLCYVIFFSLCCYEDFLFRCVRQSVWLCFFFSYIVLGQYANSKQKNLKSWYKTTFIFYFLKKILELNNIFYYNKNNTNFLHTKISNHLNGNLLN